MPLETDSNVNDDAGEQQESHIDLINETTRMKHLTQTASNGNSEPQIAEEDSKYKGEVFSESYVMIQEPKEGNSPKA